MASICDLQLRVYIQPCAPGQGEDDTMGKEGMDTSVTTWNRMLLLLDISSAVRKPQIS